jgi:hypothetical protein
MSAPGNVYKDLPERLSISIGGHFGPSYSVELENGSLTYSHSKPAQLFPPTWDSEAEKVRPDNGRWQAFRAALEVLEVWSWETRYHDPSVCDGTSWSAEIVYSDQSVVSCGSNSFPGQKGRPISIVDRIKGDTFEQFCRAVSALVGRPFR